LAAATAGLFGPVGKRTLSVRGPVSFIALWLAPRLLDFRQQWPDVSLRISTIVWAPTLQDEMADIDIRFGDGNWPGFKSSLIQSHRAIPVCLPGMAQGADDAERLQSVMSGKLLIHDTGYENLWQKLAKQAGLAFAPTAGMNIDTTISALEMAAAGVGPAIVIESLAESYIKSGRLERVVDMAIPIEESHYFVQPEGQKRLKAEAILFRDWLFKQAAL
jgi:LysR family glycine cleavage system transcriptional activator